VVLYGCETWSLTIQEEHRLKVFENRVLRRIFGLKRDEVMEIGENCIMRSFITLLFAKHNCNDQVKEYEKGRAYSMNGGKEPHRILVGEPEGKRPLGRSRSRWLKNIKMDLREIQ
jgi:hypothetical protein